MDPLTGLGLLWTFLETTEKGPVAAAKGLGALSLGPAGHVVEAVDAVATISGTGEGPSGNDSPSDPGGGGFLAWLGSGLEPCDE